MTNPSRRGFLAIAGLAVAGMLALSCGSSPRPARANRTLVVSIRSEPRTFNRYIAHDQITDAVSLLTQAKLVRINRATQQVEPWLADRWTESADGLSYTLSLRPGLRWSDGEPFTADDVLFSFRAVYDAKAGSALADTLSIGGRPLTARATDPHTVIVALPSPFAPGVRLLDNLPILPKHKLAAALAGGTFRTAWGLSTPPSDVVGLGPFVLQEYVPGQRLAFARNPHYWRTDESGAPLPHLDGISLEIVPDQNAELLRLEAGQIDTTLNEISADSYAAAKRAAEGGRLRLLDLGVGLDADSLWFNLKPGATDGVERPAWLQRDELRQAVSIGVDRRAFADEVFLGAGVPVFGPVTPANLTWYRTDGAIQQRDVGRARMLLESIGLIDRNHDGMLEDASERAARFTLVTSKGSSGLVKGAAIIRDQLKSLGLLVDVVALENAAVVERILKADYDATYFPLLQTDTDPASQLDFWLSSGSAHVWNLGQPVPATAWEREIDTLMTRQVATADPAERVRLFADVQRIFAEHQPAIYFAVPKIFVATTSRVTTITPAVQRPQTLWSADTIALSTDRR